MIEFRGVTVHSSDGVALLSDYDAVFSDGEVYLLDRAEGEMIINIILGFCPVSEGYVSFDGMPLSESSVAFLRKLVAYIPSVELFENVTSKEDKQVHLLASALQTERSILLGVDPCSCLNEIHRAEAATFFHELLSRQGVLIIATDNKDKYTFINDESEAES